MAEKIDVRPEDDLNLIIQNAEPGSTLLFSEGEYRLKEHLSITRDLNMIGVNGRPRITCSAPGAIILFQKASWNIENFEFIYDGMSGVAVYVDKGRTFHCSNCLFSGGKQGNIERTGSGLLIDGKTESMISGCSFQDNGGIGLFIRNGGISNIENCDFKSNDGGGMYVFLTEKVNATHNFFINNRKSGFATFGTDVIIKNNTVTGTGNQMGVHIIKSRGEIIDNIITSNNSGIFSVACEMTIKGNLCGENETGIQISDNKWRENIVRSIYRDLDSRHNSTRIIHNHIVGNNNGISVNEYSEAIIEENLIEQNNYGVLFTKYSSGETINNQIQNNHFWGIYIQKNAHPNIGNNSFQNNEQGNLRKPGLFG